MVEVLERGDLTFFFRPRVQPADEAVARRARPGVQSFFLVLGAAGGRHRRLRMGRKRLPARGQRLLAFVERVGSLADVIGDQLEGERYSTKTQGERYQPPARAAAQGEYALVRHDDHTHLVYRVEHAEPSDELPDEVAVPAEGSFVLLFKRRDRRRGRIWTTEGEPTALDVEDCQLVLIGTGGDHAEVEGVIGPGVSRGTTDDDDDDVD